MQKTVFCTCLVMMFLNLPLAFAAENELSELPYFKLINQDQYVTKRNDQFRNWFDMTRAKKEREKAFAAAKRLALVNVENFNNSKVSVKGPAGNTQELGAPHNPSRIYDIPAATLSRQPNGIYLIAAKVESLASDGRKTCYYPKAAVIHLHEGANIRRDVDHRKIFMDDPAIPLEIGWLPDRRAALSQRPHRNYRMELRFRGKPLPDATIVVATESGWTKRLITDDKGRITVKPFERELEHGRISETYLYTCRHYDAATQTTHVASLPVMVQAANPEWENAAHGYLIWIVMAIGMIFTFAIFYMLQKESRKKRSLAVMRNYDSEGSNR